VGVKMVKKLWYRLSAWLSRVMLTFWRRNYFFKILAHPVYNI
jgi:hypothetical protein